jgi:hypothetical protein
MQALKLRGRDGWRWISAGWQMFRRQPFSFMALLFFFWLVLLCSSALIGWFAQGIGLLLPGVSVDFVATIGSLLFAALTPALTVGFLQACRVAASGIAIHPLLLFAPFRAGRKTVTRLLSLGIIQMLVLILILLATNDSDVIRSSPPPARPAATAGAATSAAKIDERSDEKRDPAAPSAADEEEMQRRVRELTIQCLAYLPVALLMWYAPMLVAWHDVPVGKSLFFSLVGVWRNRAAFIVYGIGWLAIWMSLSIVIAVVSLIVGVGNVAAIVVAPLAMVLLTCMYCSMYQTYATVYVETPAEAPVAA